MVIFAFLASESVVALTSASSALETADSADAYPASVSDNTDKALLASSNVVCAVVVAIVAAAASSIIVWERQGE